MTLCPEGGPAGLVNENGGGFRQASWSRSVERALAIADRLVDFAGIEIRDLERIEHRQVFAVALDVSGGLHDRLVKALHVRQCRDQGLLQAGDIRPVRDQLLGEHQRGRPVALLEKGVEQQFLGHEVVRPGHRDRAQPDDRFVVAAGPQQRADGIMRPRGWRPAGDLRHRQLRAHLRIESARPTASRQSLHNLARNAKINEPPAPACQSPTLTRITLPDIQAP